MTLGRRNPLTWLGIALVVAIGTMVVFGTVAMSTYGGYYGMMGNGSWAWGLVMMAVPAVVLVLILLAVLGGLEPQGLKGSSIAPTSDPLEILDARYALGELSREEFLRAREDLGSGRTNS